MSSSAISEFIKTIARLRAPDGCPWDREQDHKSLARYLLEEAYEVVEAIHSEEPAKLKEELGDLLLQIVLHAQIGTENNEFDMEAIADGINAKMIHRHPHVFAEKKVGSAAEVVQNWEDLKKEEARASGKQRSSVDSVPNALPALLKCLKVSEKAVSEGFEWRDFDELWGKLLSEIDELKEALDAPADTPNRQDEVELEIGDVLFCMVNVARWNKLNPEESLLRAIEKFRKRYRMMESLSQRALEELSKDELSQLWAKSKEQFDNAAF